MAVPRGDQLCDRSDVEKDGVQEWTGWETWRLFAMVVPLGMLLVGLVQSSLISQAAVHLCRWPATVSCDRGVPAVWVSLSLAVWVPAGVAITDWALFVMRGRPDAGRRLLAWLAWGPYTALCTLLAIQGGVIDGVDVALGMTVVVSALWILARTIAGWTRVSERAALAMLSPLIVAALLAPVWAPMAFRAAARAEEPVPGPDGDIDLGDSHINPPDAGPSASCRVVRRACPTGVPLAAPAVSADSGAGGSRRPAPHRPPPR